MKSHEGSCPNRDQMEAFVKAMKGAGGLVNFSFDFDRCARCWD